MVICGSDSPPNSNCKVGWFQCLVNVMNVYRYLVGQMMIPPDWSRNSMECMSTGLSGLIIRVAIQNGDVGRCQLMPVSI